MTRNLPPAAPVLVDDRGVEVAAAHADARDFQLVGLPAPGTTGLEADRCLDPDISADFPWAVLRDASAAAPPPRRAFHALLADGWTTAARFGQGGYPAPAVTILERPAGWAPDSAAAAMLRTRRDRLAALRDTSTAYGQWVHRAADVLRDGGELHAAATLIEQARDRGEESAEVWFEIGLARLLEQKFDEASSALRRALSIDPDHGPAHYNLATLLEREGDVNGAESAYRRAVLLLEDPVPAHTRLGALLALRGDLDEARLELATVRRLARGGEADQYLTGAIQEAERGGP
jgi:tetratricopeptide (TPR) repeat protein